MMSFEMENYSRGYSEPEVTNCSNNNTWYYDNDFLKEDMYLSYICSFLLLLFWFFLIFVIYRVFKIVRFKDMIMLSMLFFLNLQVLLNALFFFLGGIQDNKFKCIVDMADKNYLYYTDNYTSVISQLTILFLIEAVIINLRNWIFYYIKIGEMAYYQYQLATEMSESEKRDQTLENIFKYSLPMTKGLNFLTVVFIVLNIVSYSMVIKKLVDAGKNEDFKKMETEIDTILDDENKIIAPGFGICGILFLLVGIGIQLRLKKYFPIFYQEYRCMIWLATMALFFSMFLRIFLDLLGTYNENFSKFSYQNVQWYNSIHLIMCDMIPVVFQFSTLVFGYIRRKNNQKMRQENFKDGAFYAKPSSSSSVQSTASGSSFFEPPLLDSDYSNSRSGSHNSTHDSNKESMTSSQKCKASKNMTLLNLQRRNSQEELHQEIIQARRSTKRETNIS